MNPRTWNKTVSATDTVQNFIVGATATPFGPAVIYVLNTSAADAVYVTISFMGANTAATDATATDDGVSWLLPPSKEVAFNLAPQNSTDKYNVSVIMASGKTATVYLNALQSQ